MAMRMLYGEFLDGADGVEPSFEDIAAELMLGFEADVFSRMKELGIKQKDLARLLGISPAAVSKLLSGSSNLTLKTVSKIAFSLGCKVVPPHLVPDEEVYFIDLLPPKKSVAAFVSQRIAVGDIDDVGYGAGEFERTATASLGSRSRSEKAKVTMDRASRRVAA